MVTVARPRQSTMAEPRRQGFFMVWVRRHREFGSALAFLVIMFALSLMPTGLLGARGVRKI